MQIDTAVVAWYCIYECEKKIFAWCEDIVQPLQGGPGQPTWSWDFSPLRI